MDAAPAPLAFIGTTELLIIAVVGLLLFGGDLPKVMADLGRIWVKLRRSVNEFKREAGIDEMVRDIKRETDLRLEEPRWRRDMDHAAGPSRGAPAEETPAEAAPKAAEEAGGAEPAKPAEPADPDADRPPDTGPSEPPR